MSFSISNPLIFNEVGQSQILQVSGDTTRPFNFKPLPDFTIEVISGLSAFGSNEYGTTYVWTNPGNPGSIKVTLISSTSLYERLQAYINVSEGNLGDPAILISEINEDIVIETPDIFTNRQQSKIIELRGNISTPFNFPNLIDFSIEILDGLIASGSNEYGTTYTWESLGTSAHIKITFNGLVSTSEFLQAYTNFSLGYIGKFVILGAQIRTELKLSLSSDINDPVVDTLNFSYSIPSSLTQLIYVHGNITEYFNFYSSRNFIIQVVDNLMPVGRNEYGVTYTWKVIGQPGIIKVTFKGRSSETRTLQAFINESEGYVGNILTFVASVNKGIVLTPNNVLFEKAKETKAFSILNDSLQDYTFRLDFTNNYTNTITDDIYYIPAEQESFALKYSGVNTSTIVIRKSPQGDTYTIGIDYTVYQVNNYTYIKRKWNPDINDWSIPSKSNVYISFQCPVFSVTLYNQITQEEDPISTNPTVLVAKNQIVNFLISFNTTYRNIISGVEQPFSTILKLWDVGTSSYLSNQINIQGLAKDELTITPKVSKIFTKLNEEQFFSISNKTPYDYTLTPSIDNPDFETDLIENFILKKNTFKTFKIKYIGGDSGIHSGKFIIVDVNTFTNKFTFNLSAQLDKSYKSYLKLYPRKSDPLTDIDIDIYNEVVSISTLPIKIFNVEMDGDLAISHLISDSYRVKCIINDNITGNNYFSYLNYIDREVKYNILYNLRNYNDIDTDIDLSDIHFINEDEDIHFSRINQKLYYILENTSDETLSGTIVIEGSNKFLLQETNGSYSLRKGEKLHFSVIFVSPIDNELYISSLQIKNSNNDIIYDLPLKGLYKASPKLDYAIGDYVGKYRHPFVNTDIYRNPYFINNIDPIAEVLVIEKDPGIDGRIYNNNYNITLKVIRSNYLPLNSILTTAMTGLHKLKLATVLPYPPKVSVIFNTPVRPTWSWVTCGGGNGQFAYNTVNDINTAILTTNTSYQPISDLTPGSYTLYVWEKDQYNRWSKVGYKKIIIE